MAAIYAVAFASLWWQAAGLVGTDGILPVGHLLDAVRAQAGPERYWYLPTLCWLSDSDVFLAVQCGLGLLAAGFVVWGRAQAAGLAAMWVLYLSLVTAGQQFLGFQWDNLLLEAGFIIIFLPPWRWWRARPGDEPSRLAWFLLKLLFFKLMFSSGAVKLASGDETWTSLTALTYHYQTQPLPPWTAWYAHHLPVLVHRVSCAVMFFIELACPFLLFMPRKARVGGFLAQVLLQAMIVLTGNYGFFNYLAVLLALAYLDDGCWPLSRLGRAPADEPEDAAPSFRTRRWVLAVVTPLIVLLSATQLAGALRMPVRWPKPVGAVASWLSPLRTVNGYGLFAVMTTTRPEIVIEGSMDGATWLPYEFTWKAGDVNRRPRFVAPYQPRLDWQMWFAALGRFEGNRWLGNFMVRLLQGSPAVLRLLRHNPFPDEPPMYLRATLYDYRFSRPGESVDGRAWWVRERPRPYGPVLRSPKSKV
jgi:hypothetical protein